MTIINEAIDRLIELKGELTREERLEKADAVKLGIEALKAIKLWREEAVLGQPTHLPGETEK